MSLALPKARRRGRPRKYVPSTETGTPELLMKRAYLETAEAIDVCLERRIISDEQHRCGMHLRWLHTLRFGAPGVSALDLTRIDGYDIGVNDDPRWRAAREREYNEAIGRLLAVRRFEAVMAVCVYNERPRFLSRDWLRRAYDDRRASACIERGIFDLREGLDALQDLWRKRH